MSQPVEPAALPGLSYPLGATVVPEGVNFSVYAPDATGLDVLLYAQTDDAAPVRVIRLNSAINRNHSYWHALVPGLRAGQIYAYRAYGPNAPEKGLRFDSAKVLLDPYGKGIAFPSSYDRSAARRAGDNGAVAMRSVVIDPGAYDWEGDKPPSIPFSRSLIYEMHVRGFTQHESSGVAEQARGLFAGVIEKIPYLRDLGVTAVELLPVFAFDPQDAPGGLPNYWGYSPVSFFAPHPFYSSRKEPTAAVNEFRDMVKALHRAGIEVLLDVVYNHTAEIGANGATFCWRGLANNVYYMLEDDRAVFADYTGCGNTVNANQSVVRRIILDSLHYWVGEMHVDGFRFDLASVLSRDHDGNPMAIPPVLFDIESDPVLSNVKLIAEAWDAAGLYQVGKFGGEQWKEWNGKFRDDIRAFVRGDDKLVQTVAFRMMGSPDVYSSGTQQPERSVNFVTCHDGFTLNDLVSYNSKHNEANYENNSDGSDYNLSWNCGTEGPSNDPAILALRKRQAKNFVALTLLAVGTPMLLMGDEALRTQNGNNNAYSQDNGVSWFDWGLLEKNADIHRFVRILIAYRLSHEIPDEDLNLTLAQVMQKQQVEYHGVKLGKPDWGDTSHSLAFSCLTPGGKLSLYVALNVYRDPLPFQLPPRPAGQGQWRRWLDTYMDSPEDITDWYAAPPVGTPDYVVRSHSVVALLAENAST